MSQAAVPYGYEPDVVGALVIAVDGTWQVVETRTSLDSYQRIISGFQVIYYPTKDWHLYCHEATSMDGPACRKTSSPPN